MQRLQRLSQFMVGPGLPWFQPPSATGSAIVLPDLKELGLSREQVEAERRRRRLSS